jgi:hypothetical protein
MDNIIIENMEDIEDIKNNMEFVVLCKDYINCPYIKEVYKIIEQNTHRILDSFLNFCDTYKRKECTNLMNDMKILKIKDDNTGICEYMSVIYFDDIHQIVIVYCNMKTDDDMKTDDKKYNCYNPYIVFNEINKNIYFYYKHITKLMNSTVNYNNFMQVTYSILFNVTSVIYDIDLRFQNYIYDKLIVNVCDIITTTGKIKLGNVFKTKNSFSDIYTVIFACFNIIAIRYGIDNKYINFYINTYKGKMIYNIIKNIKSIDNIQKYNIINCLYYVFKYKLQQMHVSFYSKLEKKFNLLLKSFHNNVMNYNSIDYVINSKDVIIKKDVVENKNEVTVDVDITEICNELQNLNNNNNIYDSFMTMKKIMSHDNISFMKKIFIKISIDKKLFELSKNMIIDEKYIDNNYVDLLNIIHETLDEYIKYINNMEFDNQSLHNGNIIKYLFLIISRKIIYAYHKYDIDKHVQKNKNKTIIFRNNNIGEIISSEIYGEILDYIVKEIQKDPQFTLIHNTNGYVFDENNFDIDVIFKYINIDHIEYRKICTHFTNKINFKFEENEEISDAVEYITYNSYNNKILMANIANKKDADYKQIAHMISNISEIMGSCIKNMYYYDKIYDILSIKYNNASNVIKAIYILFNNKNINSHENMIRLLLKIALKCYTYDIYSNTQICNKKIEKYTKMNTSFYCRSNTHDIFVRHSRNMSKIFNFMNKNETIASITNEYKKIKIVDLIGDDINKFDSIHEIKNMKIEDLYKVLFDYGDVNIINELFNCINGNIFNKIIKLYETSYILYDFFEKYYNKTIMDKLNEYKKKYGNDMVNCNNILLIYYLYFCVDETNEYIKKIEQYSKYMYDVVECEYKIPGEKTNRERDLKFDTNNEAIEEYFIVKQDEKFTLKVPNYNIITKKEKCNYFYIQSFLEWLNHENNIMCIEEYYNYKNIFNLLYVKNITMSNYTDNSIITCEKIYGASNYYENIEWNVLENIMVNINKNIYYIDEKNILIILFVIYHVIILQGWLTKHITNVNIQIICTLLLNIKKKLYKNREIVKNKNLEKMSIDYYIYCVLILYMMYNTVRNKLTDSNISCIDKINTVTSSEIDNYILFCIERAEEKNTRLNLKKMEIKQYYNEHIIHIHKDNTIEHYTKENDVEKQIIDNSEESSLEKIIDIFTMYLMGYIVNTENKNIDFMYNKYKGTEEIIDINSRINKLILKYPILKNKQIEIEETFDNTTVKICNYKIIFNNNVHIYYIKNNIELIKDTNTINTINTINIIKYVEQNCDIWKHIHNKNIIYLYVLKNTEKILFCSKNNVKYVMNNITMENYIDICNNYNDFKKYVVGYIDDNYKKSNIYKYINKIFTENYVYYYVSEYDKANKPIVYGCNIPIHNIIFIEQQNGKITCGNYNVIINNSCIQKVWIYNMKNMLLLHKKNNKFDEYRIMYIIGDKPIIYEITNKYVWNCDIDYTYFNNLITKEQEELNNKKGYYTFDIHYSNMFITPTSSSTEIIRNGLLLYYLNAYITCNMDILCRMQKIIKRILQDNDDYYIKKVMENKGRYKISADIPFNYFYQKLLYGHNNIDITNKDVITNQIYPTKHGLINATNHQYTSLTLKKSIIDTLVETKYEYFNNHIYEKAPHELNMDELIYYVFLKNIYIEKSNIYEKIVKKYNITYFYKNMFLFTELNNKNSEECDILINNFDNYIVSYYYKKYKITREDTSKNNNNLYFNETINRFVNNIVNIIDNNNQLLEDLLDIYINNNDDDNFKMAYYLYLIYNHISIINKKDINTFNNLKKMLQINDIILKIIMIIIDAENDVSITNKIINFFKKFDDIKETDVSNINETDVSNINSINVEYTTYKTINVKNNYDNNVLYNNIKGKIGQINNFHNSIINQLNCLKNNLFSFLNGCEVKKFVNIFRIVNISKYNVNNDINGFMTIYKYAKMFKVLYEIVLLADKFNNIGERIFLYITLTMPMNDKISGVCSDEYAHMIMKIRKIYGNDCNNTILKFEKSTFIDTKFELSLKKIIRMKQIMKETDVNSIKAIIKNNTFAKDIDDSKNKIDSIYYTVYDTYAVDVYMTAVPTTYMVKGVLKFLYKKMFRKKIEICSLYGLVNMFLKNDIYLYILNELKMDTKFIELFYGKRIELTHLNTKFNQRGNWLSNNRINKNVSNLVYKYRYILDNNVTEYSYNKFNNEIPIDKYDYCVINTQISEYIINNKQIIEYMTFMKSKKIIDIKYKDVEIKDVEIKDVEIKDVEIKDAKNNSNNLTKYVDYYYKFKKHMEDVISPNNNTEKIKSPIKYINNKIKKDLYDPIFNYTDNDKLYNMIYKYDKKYVDYIFDMIINKYINTMSNKEFTQVMKEIDMSAYIDNNHNYTYIHMIYQFLFGSLYRKQQYNLINEIVEDIGEDSTTSSLFKHLLMGGGKSVVILPVICLLLQYEKLNKNNNGIIIIVPDTLIYETYNILIKYIGWISNKHIRMLYFERHMDKVSFSKNVKILTNSDIKIISDFCIKTCMLQCSTDGYNENKAVFKNITKQYILYDEIDLILDPLKSELNHSIDKGNKITDSNIKFNITYDILYSICSKENNINKLFNTNTISYDPHFHVTKNINFTKNKDLLKSIFEKINENLECYSYKKIPNFETFVSFLNKEKTEFDEELIEIYKFLYKFIINILPNILTKIHGIHYGMTNTTTIKNKKTEIRDMYAIPYIAANTPSKNSEFSDYYYKITYTILSILHGELRDSDIDMLLQQLNLYGKYYSYIINKINKVITNFKDLLNNKILESILFIKYNKKYSNVYTELKNNKYLKKMYLNIVINKLTYIPKLYNYSSIDLVGYEHNKKTPNYIGFTGTPFLPDIYRLSKNMIKNKPVLSNEIELGAIVSSILNATGIININNNDGNIDICSTTINNIINHKCNSLIDIGYFIIEKSTEQTMIKIKKILENSSQNKYEYYVFIDNENDQKKYIDTNNNVQLYVQPPDKQKMFVYFDQKHITGFDIQQYENAVALVTIRETTTFRDAAQGIFRMRNINKGQHVVFLLLDCNHITDTVMLLNMLLNNENNIEKKRILVSLLQNSFSIFRNDAIEKKYNSNDNIDVVDIKKNYTNFFNDSYQKDTLVDDYIYSSELHNSANSFYNNVVRNNHVETTETQIIKIDNWENFLKYFRYVEKNYATSEIRETQNEYENENEIEIEIANEIEKNANNYKYILDFSAKYTPTYKNIYEIFSGVQHKINEYFHLVFENIYYTLNYHENIKKNRFNNIGIVYDRNKYYVLMEYEFVKIYDYYKSITHEKNIDLFFYNSSYIFGENNQESNIFSLLLFAASGRITNRNIWNIYFNITNDTKSNNISHSNIKINSGYLVNFFKYIITSEKDRHVLNNSIFIQRSLIYIIDNYNENDFNIYVCTFVYVVYILTKKNIIQNVILNTKISIDIIANIKTWITEKYTNEHDKIIIKKYLDNLFRVEDFECDTTIHYLLYTSDLNNI